MVTLANAFLSTIVKPSLQHIVALVFVLCWDSLCTEWLERFPSFLFGLNLKSSRFSEGRSGRFEKWTHKSFAAGLLCVVAETLIGYSNSVLTKRGFL